MFVGYSFLKDNELYRRSPSFSNAKVCQDNPKHTYIEVARRALFDSGHSRILEDTPSVLKCPWVSRVEVFGSQVSADEGRVVWNSSQIDHPTELFLLSLSRRLILVSRSGSTQSRGRLARLESLPNLVSRRHLDKQGSVMWDAHPPISLAFGGSKARNCKLLLIWGSGNPRASKETPPEKNKTWFSIVCPNRERAAIWHWGLELWIF